VGWLDGQVALVVGGTSGIGRAVVDAFVAEGARVAAFGRSEAKLHAIDAAHGPQVLTLQGDATQYADLEHAVARVTDAFGRLDTLVCCTGVFDSYRSILDLTPGEIEAGFDEIFATNVKSYMLAVKAALPGLLDSNGSIILTLSTAAFYPEGGGLLYGASKWATRGLVVHLAHQLAPRVRVNGVAPGGTSGTDLRGLHAFGQATNSIAQVAGRDERIRATTPMRMVPTPDDHAAAYVYLAATARSRAVTGVVINTDGGRGIAGLTRLAGLAQEGEPP